MADLLQDFVSYFTSLNLVVAGAVFTDTILDTPDSATAIYEYQGNAGLPQVSGVYRPVQIVTRDQNASSAKMTANALYNSLLSDSGIINLTVNRWCVLAPKETPFRLKVDAKERVYYCFNVHVTTYHD